MVTSNTGGESANYIGHGCCQFGEKFEGFGNFRAIFMGTLILIL